MVSFVRSDFRIGQAASYDLIITKCTLFSSTSMSSFEEGTGTVNIFVPARATNISKHFSLALDFAFNLEPNIQVILI